MSVNEWFYIRSTNSGHVISAIPNEETYLRSQVIVTAPTLNDHELWCWKGQCLTNKATDLVLDIREARLRLIEDTDICLYHPKNTGEADNQLWSVRKNISDSFGRPLPGSYIYSLSIHEWVFDVLPWKNGMQKLVLFPLQPIDNDNQRWIFVPEGRLDLNMNIQEALSLKNTIFTPSSCISSPPICQEDFPRGLTPAKRGSHSNSYSMETYKDYHNRVYTAQEPNISDKGIAMATAYHIFQNWKLDQISNDIMNDFPVASSSNEIRSRLQLLTQSEVSKVLSNYSLYVNNNKESTASLSTRLITQLYDQTPISP